MSCAVHTVKEMHDADKRAITIGGMTADTLMKRAGKAIFDALIYDLNPLDQPIFVVVAGCGYNGGDALVAAEYLHDHGFSVMCFTLPGHHVNPDTLIQQRHIQHKGISFIELSQPSMPKFEDALKQASILLDGLFGSGFSGIPTGIEAKVISSINQAVIKVISIDAPSGLNLENGLTKGVCVYADITYAIAGLKVGHLIQDAMDVTGTLKTIDIGLDPYISEPTRYCLEPSTFIHRIQKRKHNSHKYSYGHVMTVGGSKGMMGAPHLTLHAALMSGAGLATGIYRESDYPYHITTVPELMHASYRSPDEFKAYLSRADVIIFGNGLGKETIDPAIVRTILDQSVPIVFDADGLRHLKPYLNANLPHLVITPHANELRHMLDITLDELNADPLAAVEALAHKTHMTVLLKGPCSIVSDGNRTAFSTFGHPGLAKAGSGDVLAGIIAARLANGCQPFDAVTDALYIHGRAASLLCEKTSELSIMATDLIRTIPEILNKMT